MDYAIKNLLVIVALFSGINLSAQCMQRPVSLSEKLDVSHWVFEGTVLSQEYRYNAVDQHIYTISRVEVLKNHKNELPRLVHLACRGGTWNDLTELVTPSLQLNVGDKGLFFTNSATTETVRLQSSLPLLCPALGAVSFDPITVEIGAGSVDNAPVITAISPVIVTAGTGDVLTIEGSGFGNGPTGFALLQVRNPDFVVNVTAFEAVLFNHILSWSDSQIKFLVPGRDVLLHTAGAGSGAVRVINPFGQSTTSSAQVQVLYNRFVTNLKSVGLKDANSEGGYTFSLNQNLFQNMAAREALDRAMTTWKCTAHSNSQLSATPVAASCANMDNINLISFDDACSLPIGTLAQTTQWFTTCPNGNQVVLEQDILLDKSVVWHYGPDNTPGDKFDFESLILHELGHAHCMGHTLDSFAVMYPALYPGDTKRILDVNSQTGAGQVLSESSTTGFCGNNFTYTLWPDCETGLFESIQEVNTRIFPNPVAQEMNIAFDVPVAIDMQICLISATGQIVTRSTVRLHAGASIFKLDLAQVPSGTYFVQLANEKQVLTRRIVKY